MYFTLLLIVKAQEEQPIEPITPVLEQLQSYEDIINEHIIELNDENFEHETQATTGGTTGDWLITFWYPDCLYCKAVLPQLAVVSQKIKEVGELQISVGRIDVEQNELTRFRFGFTSYPKIILMSKGKYYIIDEQKVSKKYLLNYLENKVYQNQESYSIPQDVSLLDRIIEKLSQNIVLNIIGGVSTLVIVLIVLFTPTKNIEKKKD